MYSLSSHFFSLITIIPNLVSERNEFTKILIITLIGIIFWFILHIIKIGRHANFS